VICVGGVGVTASGLLKQRSESELVSKTDASVEQSVFDVVFSHTR
jgi:hypothetical protein